MEPIRKRPRPRDNWQDQLTLTSSVGIRLTENNFFVLVPAVKMDRTGTACPSMPLKQAMAQMAKGKCDTCFTTARDLVELLRGDFLTHSFPAVDIDTYGKRFGPGTWKVVERLAKAAKIGQDMITRNSGRFTPARAAVMPTRTLTATAEIA